VLLSSAKLQVLKVTASNKNINFNFLFKYLSAYSVVTADTPPGFVKMSYLSDTIFHL